MSLDVFGLLTCFDPAGYSTVAGLSICLLDRLQFVPNASALIVARSGSRPHHAATRLPAPATDAAADRVPFCGAV